MSNLNAKQRLLASKLIFVAILVAGLCSTSIGCRGSRSNDRATRVDQTFASSNFPLPPTADEMPVGIRELSVGSHSTASDATRSSNDHHHHIAQVAQASFTTAQPAVERAQDFDSAPSALNLSSVSRDASVANDSLIAAKQMMRVDLQMAEDLALGNHPAVAQIHARIESLRGAWVQAGLRNNPVLGYQGSEIGNNGRAGQNGVYVGGTIQRGGKRCYAQQVIANDINVAQTELAVAQRRIRNGVRQEFVKALVAQRRLQLSKELEQIAAKTEEGVQKLFDAEEVSQIDLLRAEVAANKADILRATAKTKYDTARLSLSTAMLVDEGQTLVVEGNLTEQPVDYFDQMDWESAVASALEANPQLVTATAARLRATSQLALERSKAIQDLQTQFSVAYDDDTKHMIGGIQVGVPIPVFDQNQGAIHQAMNEIAVSDQEIQRIELALKQRMARLLGDYQTAKQRSERLAETIIPSSEKAYQLISEGYAAGETDFTTLAAAQQALVEARLLRLDSIEQMWTAFYSIDGLIVAE